MNKQSMPECTQLLQPGLIGESLATSIGPFESSLLEAEQRIFFRLRTIDSSASILDYEVRRDPPTGITRSGTSAILDDVAHVGTRTHRCHGGEGVEPGDRHRRFSAVDIHVVS